MPCWLLCFVPCTLAKSRVWGAEHRRDETNDLTTNLRHILSGLADTSFATRGLGTAAESREYTLQMLVFALNFLSPHNDSSFVLILMVDPAAVFYLAAMLSFTFKTSWDLMFVLQCTNRQLRRWMIMMCPKCPGWVRRVCRGGAGQGLTMTGMVSAHSSQWRYDSHSDPRTVRHTTRQYHVQTLCE